MPDIPRQQLQYIMTQFGRSVCDEPKRCEALLKDLCPNHKREVRLLVVALREGVVKTLTYPPSFLTIENVIMQLVQRLYDEWGIAVELGQWAVETWAMVLGLKFNKTTNTLTTAKSVSLPNVTVKAVVTAQKKPISPAVTKQFKGWQKIGLNGEKLAVDAPQWAAVIDEKNKLMWAVNPSRTADFPNPKKAMNWHQAIRLAKQVSWCGYYDWRLPTIEELKTVITENKQSNLYIRQDIFNDINDEECYWIWSSSILANNKNFAWLAYLNYGDSNYSHKDNNRYIRLVRSC